MRKKYVWIDDIIDGENNRKYNNDAYSISFDDLIIHDDEEMSVSEYLEQEEYKRIRVSDNYRHCSQLISSLGECYIKGFSTFSSTWGSIYYGYISDDAKIPKDITEIPTEMFKSNQLIKYVYLPDGIKKIGYSAFENCVNLKRIRLSESITEIPARMFYGCQSLREVILPEGIKKIGRSAFAYCDNLLYVKIPSSVSEIPENMFYGCKLLQDIIWSDGIKKIGRSTFENCDMFLRQVRIPAGITEIPERMFFSCKYLQNVYLHNGINSIGKWAFAYCSFLKHVRISANINDYIPDTAFLGCILLERVEIPQQKKKFCPEKIFQDYSSLEIEFIYY